MIEQTLDIGTGEGAMETFFNRPEAGGRFPAVIVYMDIWGVREELFDIARRIAAAGYCGIVPDLYYREGRKRFDTRGPTVNSCRRTFWRRRGAMKRWRSRES